MGAFEISSANLLYSRGISYGHVFIAFWYTGNSLQINRSMVKQYPETQIHLINNWELLRLVLLRLRMMNNFFENSLAVVLSLLWDERWYF